MHLPGVPCRRPTHLFTNHTLRLYEVQDSETLRSPPPAMFGPTGMLVGPDLVPRVAQTKSEAPACKSSLVEDRPCQASVDSEKCAQSQDESSPTSSELSAQAAPRVPFLDDMMTQTNMLVLPPSNPSYQMAYFLKTTGPVAELPSKPARGKRISLAMRLFKSSNRRPSENLSTAQKRCVYIITF